ncbi:MAG: glycosyltransferase family 2 protein [Verrucomicrobia bacterium]|nr:glycosyltransferase family 2 protein [Cytophagales bacterium]
MKSHHLPLVNNSPELSIIICTYNRADLLIFSLQALAKQTLNRDKFEIIVIDNNATDHTQQVLTDFCEQFFPVKYFLESKQGLSHARNRGVAEAFGKYVAFIDDDAKAVPEWASLILHAFENVQPQPLAVGGTAFPWYESNPPDWFTEDFEKRYWGEKAIFLEKKRAKFGFGGLNMAFQKKIIVELGGFAIDLGVTEYKTRMGEDADLFYKIWKANQDKSDKIFWYNPLIKVLHFTPIRNWQVPYRKQRSLKSGEAWAIIEQTKPFSILFFKMLAFLLLQPFYLIFNVLQFKNPVKTEYVKFLQNLCFAKGYLYQSFL